MVNGEVSDSDINQIIQNFIKISVYAGKTTISTKRRPGQTIFVHKKITRDKINDNDVPTSGLAIIAGNAVRKLFNARQRDTCFTPTKSTISRTANVIHRPARTQPSIIVALT